MNTFLYSTQMTGLITKAFELSALDDVELALLMYSRSGKLTQFPPERIYEVIKRFYGCSLNEITTRRLENLEVNLARTTEERDFYKDRCKSLEAMVARMGPREKHFLQGAPAVETYPMDVPFTIPRTSSARAGLGPGTKLEIATGKLPESQPKPKVYQIQPTLYDI